MPSEREAPQPIQFRRALVTGAGGFIGRALVRRLAAVGCEINALDADPAALERLKGTFPADLVRPFRGSLGESRVLREATDGIEVVFHAAAKVHSIPRNAREEAEFYEVNVVGTDNLLRHCTNPDFRSFVFFSTIAVYRTGIGAKLTETSPLDPQGAYAQSKLEAERRVREFPFPARMRPTILRMALVYGEGERGNFSRMMRNVDTGRFVIIGDGRTRKSMIYVEDVATAALLAARSPAAQGEVFVLADPQPYEMRQLVETLARHLGVRPPRFRVPAAIMRWGGKVLGLAGRTFGFPPMFEPTDIDKLTTDTICDVTKIHNVLGFESRFSLEEGVRRTVQGYRLGSTRRREAG
jgi:nucleoside-diphosphate-sugar epimerase